MAQPGPPTQMTTFSEREVRDDPHLATGSYDPEVYWSARAEHGDAEDIETVCIFGASTVENRAADRVQRRAMRKALVGTRLRDADVLEYGCGIGRWAPWFQQRGARWAGVDLSTAMCEHARQNVSGADVRKVENNEIPHGERTFDLVYSVTVVHHNEPDQQERIVDEMVRVLRPGGTLLLFEDLGEQGAFNMFPRTVDGWRQLLEARGFQMVACRPVRYSILRSALASLRKTKTSPAPQGTVDSTPGAEPRKTSWLHRIVEHLDCWLDPVLCGLLPKRMHTSAAMAFRRRG